MEKVNSNVLVYSVQDLKGQIWSKPMFSINQGMMLREWQDVVNDKKTAYGQHPEDYCLYQIAEWNDKKGELIPLKAPLSLGLATSYLKADRAATIPQEVLNNG